MYTCISSDSIEAPLFVENDEMAGLDIHSTTIRLLGSDVFSLCSLMLPYKNVGHSTLTAVS